MCLLLLFFSEPKQCPYQYTTTQDGKCCVMVTDKVLTYDEAVSYCKESHGGLLAVDSKEKQSCMENFLKSK